MNIQRNLKFIGMYLLLSAVVAGASLLSVFPHIPQSITGWLLLFFFALPATMIIEFFGSFILEKNPIVQTIGSRTADRHFSWLRIICGLFFILIGTGFFGLLIYFLRKL